MKVKFFPILFLTLLLGACSAPKDVTYFQGIDSLTPEQLAGMHQEISTKISANDLLTITVTAWNPNVAAPFNPPTYAYSTIVEGESVVASSMELFTYVVGSDGYIDFPVLGRLHVMGLTRQELRKKLEEDISKHIADPIVKVQIVNFKVTILGDVARPGVITVRSDRISILDAIGQVGDVTINANRENVLVVRESNGVKEFARLDLTDPAIFASPYYYLRQNDVVYVEPNKAKKKNSRYSQAQQYNITVFSTILSAVSIVSSMVVTIIINNKNKQ